MVLISSKKYACETCIKGHRSSACKHTDRPLFEIKKKGRPVTQCEHCRELRKTKQVHVKCICEVKNINTGPNAPSEGGYAGDNAVGSGGSGVHCAGSKKGTLKTLEIAAFPNGLPEALEASVALQLASNSSSSNSSDSDLGGCSCKSGGECHCCTPRKSAPRTHNPRKKASADAYPTQAADEGLKNLASISPISTIPIPSSIPIHPSIPSRTSSTTERSTHILIPPNFNAKRPNHQSQSQHDFHPVFTPHPHANSHTQSQHAQQAPSHHIMARVAELRPVLPKPPRRDIFPLPSSLSHSPDRERIDSPGHGHAHAHGPGSGPFPGSGAGLGFGPGPVHDPSSGTPHGSGRHHNHHHYNHTHEDLFYSPYSRAYGYGYAHPSSANGGNGVNGSGIGGGVTYGSSSYGGSNEDLLQHVQDQGREDIAFLNDVAPPRLELEYPDNSSIGSGNSNSHVHSNANLEQAGIGRPFATTCGCVDGCRCPGCVEPGSRGNNVAHGMRTHSSNSANHAHTSSPLSTSILASCSNPTVCTGCLDCTMLTLPASLPLDVPLETFDYYQAPIIDEWMRQLAARGEGEQQQQISSMTTPNSHSGSPVPGQGQSGQLESFGLTDGCGRCPPGLCQCDPEAGAQCGVTTFAVSGERGSCCGNGRQEHQHERDLVSDDTDMSGMQGASLGYPMPFLIPQPTDINGDGEMFRSRSSSTSSSQSLASSSQSQYSSGSGGDSRQYVRDLARARAMGLNGLDSAMQGYPPHDHRRVYGRDAMTTGFGPGRTFTGDPTTGYAAHMNSPSGGMLY